MPKIAWSIVAAGALMSGAAYGAESSVGAVPIPSRAVQLTDSEMDEVTAGSAAGFFITAFVAYPGAKDFSISRPNLSLTVSGQTDVLTFLVISPFGIITPADIPPFPHCRR
jgi:hypothetical protein